MSNLKLAAAVTITAVAAAGVFKVVVTARDWQRDREVAKLRRELERKEQWHNVKTRAIVVGVVAVSGLAAWSYYRVRSFFQGKGGETATI